MDMNNNLLFDDNREYLLVNRFINMKASLECSLDEESMRLLGRGYGYDLIFVCLLCRDMPAILSLFSP